MIFAGLIPLLLYMAWPSTYWNFDGVACAIALENGNPIYFFHSQHLLYGAMGYVFWKLTLFDRALPALQLLSTLLTCVGLMGLQQVLQTIYEKARPTTKPQESRLLSIVLTITLGLSSTVWTWAREAQVYPLGFAPLMWATFCLVRDRFKQPGELILLAALHAVAVLGHVIHALWVVPFGYYILASVSSPAERKRILIIYGLTLTSLVAIAYAIVIFGVVIPGYAGDGRLVQNWLLGSVGLTSDRSAQWHFIGFTAPLAWVQTTFHVFWGSFSPYASRQVSLSTLGATLISIAVFVWMAISAFTSRPGKARPLPWARLAFAWIIPYMLLIWTWEPHTEVYRFTDIAPWGILLTLGLARWNSAWKRTSAALVLGVSFMLINLTTRVIPSSTIELNETYRRMQRIVKATPETSLYVTDAKIDWIYLLYFFGRPSYDYRSVQAEPERFRVFFARQPRSVAMFGTKAAFDAMNALPEFSSLSGDLVTEAPEWYRLTLGK